MARERVQYHDDMSSRRAQVAGVMFGVLGVGLGGLLGLLWHVPWPWLGLMMVGTGIATGALVHWLVLAIADGAARGFASFILPSGDSTPYDHSFSAHDALAIRGDVNAALAAYERTMTEQPENTRVRRQAAELYASAGQAARAAEILLAMRRLPNATGADELYATQRLVDLHLGALGDEGRALVELRRLAERFAGTPEAAGARQAIERLKRDAR